VFAIAHAITTTTTMEQPRFDLARVSPFFLADTLVCTGMTPAERLNMWYFMFAKKGTRGTIPPHFLKNKSFEYFAKRCNIAAGPTGSTLERQIVAALTKNASSSDATIVFDPFGSPLASGLVRYCTTGAWEETRRWGKPDPTRPVLYLDSDDFDDPRLMEFLSLLKPSSLHVFVAPEPECESDEQDQDAIQVLVDALDQSLCFDDFDM